MACLLAAWALLGGACRGEAAPAVYRVMDDRGHTLYVLGTVHGTRADWLPLGPQAEEAWQKADVLAVEADAYALENDPGWNGRYTAAMTYPAGDSARDHLPQDVYEWGVQALGLGQERLNRLRPVAWHSLAEQKMLAALGLSQPGIDALLARRAHEEGKPVEELEGAEEQLALMERLPEGAIILELRRMIDDPVSAQTRLQGLLDAWAQGDEAAFAALMAQEKEAASPETHEELAGYYEQLYDLRNRRFARRAAEYLFSGKTALFAVGAAHVMGEGSLVEHLIQAGFRVERLP